MRLRNHVFHLKLEGFMFKISRSLSKHTVRTRNQNRKNSNLDLDIQKVELLRGDQGMEINFESELMNLKDTELRLGLPGRDEQEKRSCSGSSVRSNKRCWRESSEEEESVSKSNVCNGSDDQDNAPPAKVQVVGWPPIRSYRKNSVQQKKGSQEGDGARNMYVKVSMDGAPYLRKIDLKIYNSYPQLLEALQNMFKCTFGEYSEREGYNGSELAPTYEDKDGDWMLVGDVPWNMFMSSCKRLRIMKGSEAKGLSGL